MTSALAAGMSQSDLRAAIFKERLFEFVEEAKATGFVARALAASGVTDATVGPAAR